MHRWLCLAGLRPPSFREGAALAALVVTLASAPAAAQDPLLWGGLKPGPHAVGYRALFPLDHTRQYDPEYQAETTRPQAHRPRPILVCVWLPARKIDGKPAFPAVSRPGVLL
jgi:hypothetical protein